MRACLENKDATTLIKYYSKAAVTGIARADLIGLVVQGKIIVLVQR